MPLCLGTQMLTALSAVTPASLTVPTGAVAADIQADGGTVRVRHDAGTPTATAGMRVDDGTILTIDSLLTDVRLLAQSGSTTNVQITYFDRVYIPPLCLGTQMLTALSAVTPASLTVPTGAVAADIQADGGTVRMRVDAGAPTATVGRRIYDGTILTIDSLLTDVRLLAQSGSTMNVQITYFDRVYIPPRRLGRNLRHRQTQIAQSIGAILASADFRAPLLTSLVPARGTGAPTFTRATTAYVSDYEGVMRQVLSGEARFSGARRVRNHCVATEDLTSASWTKNSCTATASVVTAAAANSNHDVENSSAVSSVTNGVYIISVYATAGTHGFLQIAVANQPAEYANFNLTTGVVGTTGGTVTSAIEAIGGGEYRCSMTFTAGSTNRYPVFGLVNSASATRRVTWLAAGTETMTIRKSQMEDITGRTDQTTPSEYVSVGVLSAPYHGAGVDGVKLFDTTLTGAALPSTTLLGYLAEGSRTNLCLQSNAFTTTWVGYLGLGAVQDSVGPDGATSAWTLTDSSAVNLSMAYQNVTLTAATYTLSVFIKKTSGATKFPVVSIGGTTKCAFATVDTNNGISTAWTSATGYAGVNGTATCVSFNALFWRVSLVFTAEAGNMEIDLAPAATTNPTQSTLVRDTTLQGSAVFYGAQLELGSCASSYIPTTTVAVTRNADVLTYPDTGNISDTAGTSYVEFSAAGVSGLTQQVLARNTNGRFPYVDTFTDRTQLYDGTTQSNATVGASFINNTQKSAQSWGAGTKSVSYAGTAVVTSAYDGTQGTGAIAIGCNNSGTEGLGGNIRNVCIWLRKLPDATLQRISK